MNMYTYPASSHHLDATTIDDADAIAKNAVKVNEWHAQRLILLMQYTNESRRSLERFQDITDHMLMTMNTNNNESDTTGNKIETRNTDMTNNHEKVSWKQTKKKKGRTRSRSINQYCKQ